MKLIERFIWNKCQSTSERDTHKLNKTQL